MAEPTRFDHDLNIDDGIRAKTDRFDRMMAADTSGLFSALVQGFVLELHGTDSGHLYAALMDPRTPMSWGKFSGLAPAVYQLADAFQEQFEGELPAGPPVADPQGLEAFVLAGGTVTVTRESGAYRVLMQRKLGSLRRRQGAKVITVSQTAIRRGQAEDIFEAVASALEESEIVDEVLSL